MGLPRLYWLCLAFLPLSALAADPPTPRANVSTTVNPTTGYHVVNNSTIRTPAGVTVSPVRNITPYVSSYGGGLQQTMPAGVTINGVKETGTLGARVRATTQTLKGGAKTLLKGNLATVVLTAGLQQMLNGVGALINNGSVVNRAPILMEDPPEGVISRGAVTLAGARPHACEEAGQCIFMESFRPVGFSYDIDAVCDITNVPPFIGYNSSAKLCYFLAGASPDDGFNYQPVSPQDIDDAVDNSYTPLPADWPLLAPHFIPDDVEITSAPTLQSPPKTTTIYDANGNPHTVKETNIWYDFDIRDNPSSEPKLDLKERQEEKTYEDGQLSGTTTTTSTSPAPAGSGGGSQPPIELEIPTDCDFMPTVCAFIDWFKNDDMPEDPDLNQLIDDRDFEETYTITGGSKQCPADYEFTLSFIGQSYALSFEPACDFASKIYFFVMAGAYIMAAYITIGAARNG